MTEKEIQTAEALLPDMEAFLYENPEKAAEVFLSNSNFRELLLSKIPPDEVAMAEKIAKEQNATVDEIIKMKLIEIIKKEGTKP